jgi:hypothetical protein
MTPRRSRASAHNERGRAFAGRGLNPQAISEYLKAAEIDPKWSVPFYNLGLLYKYEGDWVASLRMNQRAVELDDTDQASWWNLGIAATVLEKWTEARRAWKGFGTDIPPGEGPIDYPCGPAPVRLNPNGDAEVVWSERIDPARAILRNIPYPTSGYRYGDLVLNDGAPVGYRLLGDREVPVLDCLELLEPSFHSTFVAEIEMLTEADMVLLGGMADERGLAAEDWSTSVRILCKACSEGRPHAEHDQTIEPVQGLHQVAVAAPNRAAAEALLGQWRERSESALILSIEMVTDATPA